MVLPKIIPKRIFQIIGIGLLLGSLLIVIYWMASFSGPYRFFALRLLDADETYPLILVFLLSLLSALIPVLGVVLVLQLFANVKPMPKPTGSLREQFSREWAKHFPDFASPHSTDPKYPTALRYKRILAFVVDRGLVVLGAFATLLPLFWVENQWPQLRPVMLILAILSLLALAFYAWARDFYQGQSLARRWLKLRVVDIQTGQPIGAWKSFQREACLHVFPVAILELIYLFIRPEGRRLGDLLAKTRVEAVES